MFQQCLVSHLSLKLGVAKSDIETALNSFTTSPPKQKSGKVTGRKSLIQRKCERTPRGKNHSCGKPAANEITFSDGSVHSYCGTVKKGCVKSILNDMEKKENAKTTEIIAEESEKLRKSKKPPKKAPVNPDKKIIEFLDKKRIVPLDRPQLKQIKIKSGTVWIHSGTRILFYQHQQSKRKEDSFAEAYGVLGNDETIQPLGDSEKRWLEKQRIPISDKSKNLDEKDSEKEDIDEKDSEEDVDEDSNSKEGSDSEESEDELDLSKI